MEFHKLKLNELDQCCKLVEDNFSPEHAKAFRHQAALKKGHDFYTLSDSTDILACGAFTFSPCDDSTVESYFVCVKQNEQRKGLGFELMNNMIAIAKQDETIDFCIQVCKKHLVPMYEKLNFFVLHEKSNGEFLMGMKLR